MDSDLRQISPVVSVVMSVYNGESYLREAIDSVLNQTYRNFEFIIINDGSVDKSLDIIQSYSDERIMLINNEGNKGLIYSLNRGLEISRGKFIARMDADDISLADRLKKQVEYLDVNPEIGVVGCNYIAFSEHSSRLITAIHSESKIKAFLLFTATMCHPTLLIRKQVLIDNNLRYSENAKHVEDYDLWCRMVLYTKFNNLNEVLFKYRDHASQVSHNNRAIQLTNSSIVQKEYLKKLGFTFSESEINRHFLISSNARILDKISLIEIENWFLSLLSQNAEKRIISTDEFNYVISKMWLDCCGNTKLGIWSYFYYQKSKVKSLAKIHTGLNAKLLAKCIIRWIK